MFQYTALTLATYSDFEFQICVCSCKFFTLQRSVYLGVPQARDNSISHRIMIAAMCDQK